MAGLMTMALIGILGGLVSGLFGIGGGSVFVPLLILLNRFDPHKAIATSLAVMLPAAAIALWRHSHAGMTDWKTVPVLAVFAILGAWLGAGISLQASSLLLRRLFAVYLLILSVKLCFPD
jgi:uncharacterized membrane protein YfcA